MTIKHNYETPVSYAGGKRKLDSWIISCLKQSCSNIQLEQCNVADVFSGGGSMSMSFKLSGVKHLITNDISDRSAIINTAIIGNNHQKLPLPVAHQMVLHSSAKTNFVESLYGGKVFDTYRAKKFDQALDFINSVNNPIMQAQLKLLLWKEVARSVTFATSIGTSNRPYAEALDGVRPYVSLPEKRFRDSSLEKLFTPCWSNIDKDVTAINHSIFPAQGNVSIYQSDVFELLPKIEADILYCDPPYGGTLSYEKNNQVLDTILTGKLPQNNQSSAFTTSVDALSDMFALARHIPVWVLSYNDKIIDLDALVALIQAVEPDRIVTGYSKEYAHMAHVAKRTNHELLVIAVHPDFIQPITNTVTNQ